MSDMTKCGWCKDVCGKGDINSHGICIHCQAKVSPNSPRAKRYAVAMARGHKRMVDAGLHTTTYMAEIRKWDGVSK